MEFRPVDFHCIGDQVYDTLGSEQAGVLFLPSGGAETVRNGRNPNLAMAVEAVALTMLAAMMSRPAWAADEATPASHLEAWPATTSQSARGDGDELAHSHDGASCRFHDGR